jgi:ABC-type nickel/cobalt efflux system permease component RcnA
MALTFWQHCRLLMAKTFEEFAFIRDMLLATGITVATAVLGVVFHLSTLEDWKQHRGFLILSLVAPYVIVLGAHLLWRMMRSPWKVHQEQEKSHSAVLAVADERIASLTSELARFPPLPDLSYMPTIAPESYGKHPSRPAWGLFIVNDSYPAYELCVGNAEVGPNCTLTFVGGILSRISDKDGRIFFEAWLEYSNVGRTGGGGSDLHAQMVHGHTHIDIPITYKDGKLNLWRSICRISLEPEKGNGLGVSTVSQELLAPARLLRLPAPYTQGSQNE